MCTPVHSSCKLVILKELYPVLLVKVSFIILRGRMGLLPNDCSKVVSYYSAGEGHAL